MKIPPHKPSCAAIFHSLLFVALSLTMSAQQSSPPAPEPEKKEEPLKLEALVVTSATRSAKAVDHIPGAINLITNADISTQLAFTEDVTSVLADTIPGYSPSRQSLSVTGETLRGRTPLYLLDGIPQSTPLREGQREGAGIADLSVIERVEVINGPSATEGVGASGGIINFITKTAKVNGTRLQVDSKINTQLEDNTVGWRLGVVGTHKSDDFDLMVAVATVSRGADYDANGRRLGIDANGASQDSLSHNYFAKLGYNFGANNSQRLQVALNRFDLIGNGKLRGVDGNRTTGLLATSVRGKPLTPPSSNKMQAFSLEYRNAALWGGSLNVQAYHNREAILFNGDITPSRQDPAIAPVGTLIDQSAIFAKKQGLRSSYVRPDLFTEGLELSLGLDVLHDETDQKLVLSSRQWVPPLKYSSAAPFAQLEYERGPLTLRGGVRKDDATLKTDTFTTIWIPSANKKTIVQGGELNYSKPVYNIGGIWRLPRGLRAYASYSEGYSIPDVGIPLRGVIPDGLSLPQLSVLQAIISDNKEAGITWGGKRGSFGVSYYKSYSPLSGVIVFNTATQLGELRRVPTDIKGWEATGEFKAHKRLVFNMLYSRIRGLTTVNPTTTVPNPPLDVALTSRLVPPDRLTGVVKWAHSERGHVRLQGTKLFSHDRNVGRGVVLEERFTGYTLVSLNADYRTKKWGTWSVGVENLTNKYYLPAFTLEPSTGVSAFTAGRGRVFSLSNSLTF